MRECPRFNKCNVNVCLLDNLMSLRKRMEGEPKCTMAKSIRLRIGKKYKLPKMGLTSREYAGYKKWENKSEEEKDEARKQMVKVREKVSLKSPESQNFPDCIVFSELKHRNDVQYHLERKIA